MVVGDGENSPIAVVFGFVGCCRTPGKKLISHKDTEKD